MQKQFPANLMGNSIHDADAAQQSKNITFTLPLPHAYFAILQTALRSIRSIHPNEAYCKCNVIKLKWRHSASLQNTFDSIALPKSIIWLEQFAFVQRNVMRFAAFHLTLARLCACSAKWWKSVGCAREMDAKRSKESTIRNEGLNCAESFWFWRNGGCVLSSYATGRSELRSEKAFN